MLVAVGSAQKSREHSAWSRRFEGRNCGCGVLAQGTFAFVFALVGRAQFNAKAEALGALKHELISDPTIDAVDVVAGDGIVGIPRVHGGRKDRHQQRRCGQRRRLQLCRRSRGRRAPLSEKTAHGSGEKGHMHEHQHEATSGVNLLREIGRGIHGDRHSDDAHEIGQEHGHCVQSGQTKNARRAFSSQRAQTQRHHQAHQRGFYSRARGVDQDRSRRQQDRSAVNDRSKAHQRQQA